MRRLAIIPNSKKDPELNVTKKLIAELDSRVTVVLPREFDGKIENAEFADNVYNGVDAAIIVGGDGTVINAALPCAKADVPMLGVNLGRIGFMSEVELCSIKDAVDCLLSGDYNVETRMMMDVEITHKNGEVKLFHALNDAVIEKARGVNLIGIELFSDEEKIIQYVADGIIISTPTGSTGYNLSAGGPVVNPLMSLFVATAICPHMLTARPAVLPAEKPIVITSGCGIDSRALASVDGEAVCDLEPGDKVVITKSEYTAKLIKTVRRSFYDTLIEKLL